MIEIMNIYLKFLFLLVFSIILHEFGHWFYLKLRLKKNVSIVFEQLSFSVEMPNKDFLTLSLEEKKDLVWCGVIFGLFPILFVSIYVPYYFLLMPFYLIGCKFDLITLKRLYEE